jgi:hypothetical protein
MRLAGTVAALTCRLLSAWLRTAVLILAVGQLCPSNKLNCTHRHIAQTSIAEAMACCPMLLLLSALPWTAQDIEWRGYVHSRDLQTVCNASCQFSPLKGCTSASILTAAAAAAALQRPLLLLLLLLPTCAHLPLPAAVHLCPLMRAHDMEWRDYVQAPTAAAAAAHLRPPLPTAAAAAAHLCAGHGVA